MSAIMSNRDLFNTGLESFAKFAIDENHNAKQSAKVTNLGYVRAANNEASWWDRRINSDVGKASVAENNAVRNAFLSALKDQFQVDEPIKLPKPVLEALRGTYAKGDLDDFGCGKPLTQRRIHAVLTAVNEALNDKGLRTDITTKQSTEWGTLQNRADQLATKMASLDNEIKALYQEQCENVKEMDRYDKEYNGIYQERNKITDHALKVRNGSYTAKEKKLIAEIDVRLGKVRQAKNPVTEKYLANQTKLPELEKAYEEAKREYDSCSGRAAELHERNEKYFVKA